MSDNNRTTLKVWSKAALEMLAQKAEEFIEHDAPHHDFKRLKYVTRDKDPDYFADIFENESGIMKKYMKDFYGNPESPINGRLEGLFFRAIAHGKGGQPFKNSPFGSRRLQLPANYLITADKHLYFCDFYCMYRGQQGRQSGKHNITLVLCEPGSEADEFCRAALPRLDINDNGFLFLSGEDDNDEVFVTMGAYVEVFYTEDMDLSHLQGFFKDVHEFHKGRAKNPRKNKDCPFCNLTPLDLIISDLKGLF